MRLLSIYSSWDRMQQALHRFGVENCLSLCLSLAIWHETHKLWKSSLPNRVPSVHCARFMAYMCSVHNAHSFASPFDIVKFIAYLRQCGAVKLSFVCIIYRKCVCVPFKLNALCSVLCSVLRASAVVDDNYCIYFICHD